MIIIDYKPTKKQCQILCDPDILGMIRNHFSVKNDGAFFAKRKGHRFVKDRKYAITPTGLFDFGLYGEILKYFRDNQITEISFTDSFKKRVKTYINEFEFWNKLSLNERYYQKDTIINALKRGYGTIVLGTGAGKSMVQALLIENFTRLLSQNDYHFKCLIIVPGLSLVKQLANDFKDYGVTFEYSEWTGSDELQDTEVVICNSENLNAKFLNNPWLLNVNLLICDECHKINDDANITKLISKINTVHKFGFTGTLSDKLKDRWKTIGTFGPILYEKKSKELRDEEFLSDVRINMIQLNHSKIRNLKYKDELKFLYESEKRGEIIEKIASKSNGNVLILVNHLDHCDLLFDQIKKRSGKECYVVKGEVEVDERKRIIGLMENGNNIICIAMSSIFSTGINIKNLPNIIFAGLGKSFIRIVQSIGRGLRLHENKIKLNIYDIFDNYKYSNLHAIHRQGIYDKEEIEWRIKEINIL